MQIPVVYGTGVNGQLILITSGKFIQDLLVLLCSGSPNAFFHQCSILKLEKADTIEINSTGVFTPELKYMLPMIEWHSGAKVRTLASQQQVSFCVELACSVWRNGFSQSTPASSHSPKTCFLTLYVDPVMDWRHVNWLQPLRNSQWGGMNSYHEVNNVKRFISTQLWLFST